MTRIFWGGLLVFLLVACGGSGPEAKVTSTFILSVDPAAQTVEVSLAGAGTVNQTSGARALVPGEDLAVAGSGFVFLPGNVLSLELAFKNVSPCTFKGLVFSRGADSRAVVSSVEPAVTSADLGGDDALAPSETTRALQFGVTHMGKPFTYVLAAEADATCGPGPSADLQVNISERFGDPVTPGKDIKYFVNVRNAGPEPATGVKLTVVFPFALASAVEGCVGGGNDGLTCTIDDIPVDNSKGVTLKGKADEEGEFTVSAKVSANETDPNPRNNSASEKTTVTLPAEVCTNPVAIPDSALEKAVRNELKKPTGDLRCADLERLTTLSDADVKDEENPEFIGSLEGLQFAVNLTTLRLNSNSISDLSPLSGLTKLTELALNENYEVSDLEPLSDLTNLTKLLLYNNKISDLTPLRGLKNLTDLQLGLNNISDVTPLSGLTNLSFLDLYFNKIKIISALVENEGLGDGEDFIDLSQNCLSAAALGDADKIEARNPNFKNVNVGRQCNP